MGKKADNPGVFVPPPTFFIGVYCLGYLLQRWFPIKETFFDYSIVKIIGIILCIIAMVFGTLALLKFLVTKNTVVTHWPANSLQTSGIYSVSRNPMYFGLLLFYMGFTFFTGSWWNVILLPLPIILVQLLVIRKEEEYLERKFWKAYLDYKGKVRRWI